MLYLTILLQVILLILLGYNNNMLYLRYKCKFESCNVCMIIRILITAILEVIFYNLNKKMNFLII